VDFANLITRKLSLLICAHVSNEMPVSSLESLKQSVNMWMRDHGMKAFYSVAPSNTFDDGAISQMSLAGLGEYFKKLIIIFKKFWQLLI